MVSTPRQVPHYVPDGYHTCAPFCFFLRPLKGLKVSRVEKEDPTKRSSYRQHIFRGFEAILGLYPVGVNTRAISRFLENIYGAFYSPQGISRLISPTGSTGEGRGKNLTEEALG